SDCEESASKKRTSLRISPSEKLKVGIRTRRYCRTPSRLVSVSLSEGLFRKRISHSGLTRAPSPISVGGFWSFQSGSWYRAMVSNVVVCPTWTLWQPMQLYLRTTHQP